MSVVESTISNLVKQQFPEFYHEEGPIFVAFVQKYFEWLESSQPVANLSYAEAKQNCKINVVAGNNTIRATSNAATFTNCFSNGALIAIYNKTDGSDYNLYTVNTVISDIELTLTEAPDFSLANTRFSITSTQKNPVRYLRDFYDDIDVDTTSEEFLVYFKEKYLKNVRLGSDVDTRRLIKHALDIYRSKGTERGADLLFKMVYGVPAKFYYPGNDLFRLSDGQWTVPKYIEVALKDTNKQLIGKQIFGYESGATAFAEAVVRKTIKGKLTDIIFISAINGTFITGETINSSDYVLDKFDRPHIIGSFTTLEITYGGQGFSVGDILTIESTKGENATVRVDTIENIAGLVDFDLNDGGYGYSLNSEILISEYVLSISNLDGVLTAPTSFNISPVTNSYFYLFDDLVQPLANVAFANSTGAYSSNDNVYTYHGNGSVKATGVVLEVSGNTTQGNLIISVPGGSAVADFNDSRIYGEGNTVNSDISSFSDITAVGNTFCLGETTILTIDSIVGGSFSNNETVVQYSNAGKIVGQGKITLITDVSGPTLTLRLSEPSGLFFNNLAITGLLSGTTGNVNSQQVSFGVKDVRNDFYIDNRNYCYLGADDQIITGEIQTKSAGDSANFTIGTLNYTETIDVNNDYIIDYYNYPLTHTALTGTVSINTSSNTVTGTGTAFDTEVGYDITGNVTSYTSSITGINGANTITGIGTDFVNELVVGDILEVDDTYYTRVRKIVNSTFMFVSNAPANSVVSVIAKKAPWLTFTDGANIESHQVASVTSNTELILVTTPTFVSGAATVTPSWGFPGNTSANLTNDNLASIFSNTSITIGSINTIDGINPGENYASDPCIKVYEAGSLAYKERNDLITISSTSGVFGAGDLVQQSATGARGIILNYTPPTMIVKRLRLLDSDNFIPTINSTTYITSANSGGIANVDSIEPYVESEFLGFNANVTGNVIIGEGSISNVQVLTTGFGFEEGEEISVFTDDGRELNGIIHLGGGIGTGTGYYRRTGSFLSSDDKLLDAYYYQDFSYEIRSSIPLSSYESMLKQLIHVAGTKYYGKFVYEAFANSVMDTNTALVTTNTLPGYYVYPGVVPKTIADFAGVKNNGEEYFQYLGAPSTFDDMMTYAGLVDQPAVMVDSDGKLKHSPHNRIGYTEALTSWGVGFATLSSFTDDLPVGIDSTFGFRVTEDTTPTQIHQATYQTGNATILPGAEYTMVLYARSSNRDLLFRMSGWAFQGGRVDLTTGAISSVGGLITSLTAVDAGSGWWKITLVAKATSAGGIFYVTMYHPTVGTTYSGDGTSYLDFTEPRMYRSDLGGMVNDYDTGTDYVFNDTGAILVKPRRKSWGYDPSSNTFIRKGITIEGHLSGNNTNEFLHSVDTSNNTYYGGAQATVAAANVTDCIIGTSMWAVTDNGSNNAHLGYNSSFNGVSDTDYTMSCYYKAGTQPHAQLVMAVDGNNYVTAVFDLANVAIGETSVGVTSGTLNDAWIKQVDYGIFLLGLSGQVTGSAGYYFGPAASANGNSFSATNGGAVYSGNSDEAGYFFGTQIEAGVQPPSMLIPTADTTNEIPGETLKIAAAKMTSSTTAMSFHMKGELSNPDTDIHNEVRAWYWINANSDYIDVRLDSRPLNTNDGNWEFLVWDGTNTTGVTSGSNELVSGIHQPFNIASTHKDYTIGAAVDGTLKSVGATDAILPDFSAVDIDLFKNGASPSRGTIAIFQQDDNYWFDTGVIYVTS